MPAGGSLSEKSVAVPSHPSIYEIADRFHEGKCDEFGQQASPFKSGQQWEECIEPAGDPAFRRHEKGCLGSAFPIMDAQQLLGFLDLIRDQSYMIALGHALKAALGRNAHPTTAVIDETCARMWSSLRHVRLKPRCPLDT